MTYVYPYLIGCRGIENEELHPDDYFLADVGTNQTEDECFDFLSEPRQTQTTIGLHLKKKKNTGKKTSDEENERFRKRTDPNQIDLYLEKLLTENKGFWIDKPTLIAPLVNKLKDLYSVEIPKKDPRKSQGIFYRPEYLELDHLIKLGKAGLLYTEEEATDSEEEVKSDYTMCVPFRKKKYRICDPCKTKREKVGKSEDVQENTKELVLPFKKIPTGCQCNYYGQHNKMLKVWDCPFQNEVDMVRNHEMNKYLKHYKSELLNDNYKKNPPVFFKPVEPQSKRTFPDLMLSNL